MQRLLSSITLGTAIFFTGAVAVMADSKLKVFDWAGYDDPAFFEKYVTKYGDKPHFSFFASDIEALSKVGAGFKPDLSDMCVSTLDRWVDEGLVKPINTSLLPEWENVSPTLRNMATQDGEVWMVPFNWGYSGLVYRTDKVDKNDLGLDVFVNPVYKDRVSMLGTFMDPYSLAFIATGAHSFTDLSDDQVDMATEWLRRAHQNVQFYWRTAGDINQALANGEIEAAWAWNQTYAELIREGHSVDMLQEPSKVATWACGYVHIKESEASDEEVYDFLNAVLDPQSGANILEAWNYGPANTRSFELVDQKTIESAGFDSDGTLLENSFFQSTPAPELYDTLSRSFAKIKSGL